MAQTALKALLFVGCGFEGDVLSSPPRRVPAGDTGDTEIFTGFKVAKAVVGAGSFALPLACKNQGAAGGVITIAVAGVLASLTMKSLMRSKDDVEKSSGEAGLSYVDLARAVLGDGGANFVFAMTLASSLGVCTAYLAFIGSTMSLLASQEGTWVNGLFPGASSDAFQLASVAFVAPITWLRSFSFLSLTSTVGVLAVIAALATTVAEEFRLAGGLQGVITAVQSLPLWPESVEAYSSSFGAVIFLACVNFLIFPIERSMARKENFGPTLDVTLAGLSALNAGFAVAGFAIFGAATSDIVTNNLGSASGLTAIKTLICVDLLLTYPLVFAAGREITERLLFRAGDEEGGAPAPSPGVGQEGGGFAGVEAAVVRSALVGVTYGIAHSSNFGLITNVVGGVAQGTLALVIPPVIALRLAPEGTPLSSKIGYALLTSVGVVSAGLVLADAFKQSFN